MARFDERSGQLYVTELGRVASHFYIRHSSIVAFNEMLRPHMSEAEVCSIPAPLVRHICAWCVVLVPSVDYIAHAYAVIWLGYERPELGR